MDSFKFILALVFVLAIILVDAQNSKQDILDAHNAPRAKLGLKPLIWNDTLAQSAMAYAEKRKDDCKMQHSSAIGYGENLAAGSGDWTCVQSVQAWNSEESNYDYNTNGCAPGKMCGHYTQVVWNTTESVGCGRVKCTNEDMWYDVCQYYPPGNYIGEKPY